MAHFVLIHGSSHGAWCWSRLVPRLEAMGHQVTAVDLPSHGADPTPPRNVTIEDYTARCLEALGRDTILVGHSLGGLTITMAAARAQDRVRALVYLCAWVPPPGVPFAEIRADAIAPEVSSAVTVDRARGVSAPIVGKSAAVFYHDCSDEDVAFALPRLSPQPVSVLSEPLDFDPPDVPRHYIRCLDDRVIKPEYQRRISADWPEDHVHEMDCGHSPFFSDPDDLARILDRIAAS